MADSSAQRITQGALMIAVFSVLSRLLGLLRDRLLATHFGASATLDAYYAAFKMPNFIFNTFVLGALASAFIPIYIKLKNQPNKDESLQLSNRVLNILVIFLLAVALVGSVFATQIVPLIAPGFSPDTSVLAVKLTRLMMFAIVIFGASNLFGSVLQAEKRFTAYAIAPVLYNLGIIVGIIILVPWFGIIGLAWGVLLGSLAHLLIQWLAAQKNGWTYQPTFGWRSQSVKQVFKLLAPRTLGLAANSLNDIITAAFISRLSVGSLAAFSLAINLHSFPINVFGVSLATAVFPVFSQAFSLKQHDDFRHHFSRSLRRILFYVIPMAVLILVLRAQLVRVLLGSGSFDWNATIRTAQMLGFLSLAMISDSLIPLVARAFYAIPDTITPVLASGASMVINFVLLLVLQPWGLNGIGVAYVIASLTNVCLLFWLLGKRLGNLGTANVVAGVKFMVAAAGLSACLTYLTLQLVAPLVNMHTFWGIFLQGLAAGGVGLLTYVFLTSWWKLPEVAFIKSIWQSVINLWCRYVSRTA